MMSKKLTASSTENSGAEPAPVRRLSAGESRVLALLAQGSSYAAIATTLSIRMGTVQTYVKRIYRKLGITSKAEAAWKFFGNGAGVLLFVMNELGTRMGLDDLFSFASLPSVAGFFS